MGGGNVMHVISVKVFRSTCDNKMEMHGLELNIESSGI
jgi:hypothetical protein